MASRKVLEGSRGLLGEKRVRERAQPEIQPAPPWTLEESSSCLRLRKKISVGAACDGLVERGEDEVSSDNICSRPEGLRGASWDVDGAPLLSILNY